MPFELSISPAVLLAMWSGGIALAIALVIRWRVVGAGFVWVAGGTSVLAGVFAFGLGPLAASATVAIALGSMVAAWKIELSAVLFAVGGVLYLMEAGMVGDPVLVVTGAVALGGTTSEMLLGHWFLVDPTLPRSALRKLDAFGIGGLVADVAVVVILGGLAGAGFLAVAFVVLGALSILMMVGVWFAIGERGYEGVMAATGLSYLSVLTSLGAVALGRFLLG